MRPDRIALQAFGPYPGRTEIDLSPAHAGRAFLICGPTGAGKSSILDGICVALFGVVSSDEAGAQGRLRCLQADPATPTEITLDFRHGGQAWRIRRRPAGQRPGRGGRMVESPAEAALWRLGPDGTETLEASGVEPVSRAVRALLGLDVAAFRAVALLPQGRWRDVLTGPAKDRERLLQEAFGTHWTEALANRLEQDAKAADAEAGAALAAADALARRIGEATSDPAAALAAARDAQAAAEAACAAAEAEDRLLEARLAEDAGRAMAERLRADAAARADAARLAKTQADARLAEAEATPDPAPDLARADQALAACAEALRTAEVLEALALDATQTAARLADAERQAGRTAAALAAADVRRRAEDARLAEARRWHAASAAARLAQDLADGAPCPVCGSRHHPEPAEPPAGTGDRLEAAEAAHAKALEGYLQAAGADAAAQAGQAIAAEAHAEAARRRDAALAAAPDLDPAAIRAERAALRAEAEGLRQMVERRTQTLVQLRQGVAAASASLAQAEAALAGLPPAAPADPTLPERRQAARAALAEAAAAAEAARRRHGALEADLAAWSDAKASADAAEAARGDARALADLAAGRKGDRVSFARFALGWLLDQALAGASRHLAALTEGRYALHRQAAGTDGRRAAGLDLEVEDRWDGTRRACATLSGGEGFLAALALALGVSETLQALHGGRALGMLILDEGFGSLDPDALDQAADALLGLAAAGRTVGAVSHVPGLEARLGLRLRVRPGRQGSSVAWEGT